MAYNTTISQGIFTATGNQIVLPIPSGVDWMAVRNFTELTAANANHGVEYFWQRGLVANNGFVTLRNAGATAVNMTTSAALAVGGFTLYDSSIEAVGAPFAITNISNGGLVLTANTTGLSVGSLVVLNNIANFPQLAGITFVVTAVNPGVSFTITPPVPFAGGATTGNWQLITFPTYWYPTAFFITNITQANPAVVTTSMPHGYTVGQAVRINIPMINNVSFGMVQLNTALINSNVYNIVSVPTPTTFGINVDSTGFTAFAFPLPANYPFTPAIVNPVGEETDTGNVYNPIFNPNLLDDATVNTATRGLILSAGITSPGGSVNDVIYWIAGKSFNQ